MYILAQDQNGLVRSKHKGCVFVPPKSTIFPPLYGVRLVWPISLISFAVSTAGSWRRPGVDAEKHVACVRRYLRLQVHEISFAAVAGLCRGIVCADCIPFCLLPRLWMDKHSSVLIATSVEGQATVFDLRVCGQVSAGRSMRTHKFFCFDPRLWDGKL